MPSSRATLTKRHSTTGVSKTTTDTTKKQQRVVDTKTMTTSLLLIAQAERCACVGAKSTDNGKGQRQRTTRDTVDKDKEVSKRG